MIFGWDLGGAHVKAAMLDRDGGPRAWRSGLPALAGARASERALRALDGGDSSRARRAR